MKQPDLGKKVSELRQQKGITQEQLAERCEVSTRTVQRIESGEVDPRSFTINRLSEELDFDFGEDSTDHESLWLTIMHLSCSIPLVIIPLLIWSWKKNQSYKIDRHGRDVLNFQITMLLLLFASLLVVFIAPIFLMGLARLPGLETAGMRIGLLELLVIIVPAPLILIGIFTTFQGVINAVRVLSDRPYRYRFTIPFVK